MELLCNLAFNQHLLNTSGNLITLSYVFSIQKRSDTELF